MKIKSFSQLYAWQEAHKLVLKIYEIIKTFPPDERFGLSDQMKRASISVSSNIAEGFSRRSKREKAQFFYMALGSLTELENQLIVSKDVGYISLESSQIVFEQIILTSKLINGLIKSSKLLST